MNKLLILVLLNLIIKPYLFSQSTFISYNENGNIIINENVKKPDIKSNRITTSISNVSMTAHPDTIFPENKVEIVIDFSPTFDLSAIKFLVFSTLLSESINPPNSPYLTFSRVGKTIVLESKSIDMVNRRLKIKLGGLKPNTEYLLKSSYFGYDCGGNTMPNFVFKTLEEKANQQKKVLIIVDKEFENDLEIDQALNNYINHNIKFYKHLHFEKYYVEANNNSRNVLYEKIKLEHQNSALPIKYLFFIGSNAGTYLKRIRLDPITNQIKNEYNDLSINFYSQISLPEFKYDPVSNVFNNIGYQLCNISGLPVNNISDTIVQSTFFDIAYGSLMPNGLLSNKNSILNYFVKLNSYKKGNLRFNKSVLFADTFYNDGQHPAALANINSRWIQNDTINIPQKFEYGIGNTNSYPAWTQDYLSKLSSNSYEICTYMGHGDPGIHLFDISWSALSNLPTMNTMIFDFISCNTGFFYANRYLAGSYLDTGNTLFVKAYTIPIGTVVYDNKSPLIYFFRKNEVFDGIERKMFFGDAYLFNLETNITQIQLGDPLLQLDPPCTQNSILLASPQDDNVNQNTLVSINSVTASNIIKEKKYLEVISGQNTLLIPGFEAKKGSVFVAKIEGCE